MNARLLALLFLSLPCIAQQSTISGRVLDSTNAVLPGVTIEAGETFTTVSSSDGSYVLTVPAGTYDVRFHLLNFATVVRRNVSVTAGAASRVDATLYLASSADVVVTAKQTFRNLADLDEAANDLLGVADAASAGVITSREIDRRPFQRAGEILETVPGVIVSQHSDVIPSVARDLGGWGATEVPRVPAHPGPSLDARDDSPDNHIPGAIEGVASVGLNVLDIRGFSGELRWRHFGPRPLIEDDSVRSGASNLLNARIGYRFTPRVRLDLDVFNILDAKVSDVDYFYTSRLPGESAAGIDDVHFHPVEKRSARLALVSSFSR